jgi:hypothetical protein
MHSVQKQAVMIQFLRVMTVGTLAIEAIQKRSELSDKNLSIVLYIKHFMDKNYKNRFL